MPAVIRRGSGRERLQDIGRGNVGEVSCATPAGSASVTGSPPRTASESAPLREFSGLHATGGARGYSGGSGARRRFNAENQGGNRVDVFRADLQRKTGCAPVGRRQRHKSGFFFGPDQSAHAERFQASFLRPKTEAGDLLGDGDESSGEGLRSGMAVCARHRSLRAPGGGGFRDLVSQCGRSACGARLTSCLAASGLAGRRTTSSKGAIVAELHVGEWF